MKKMWVLSFAAMVLSFANWAQADVVLNVQSVQDAQYRKVMALAQSVVTSKIYEITKYEFQKVSSWGEFCIVTVGDEKQLLKELTDLMGDDETVSVRIEAGYCK